MPNTDLLKTKIDDSGMTLIAIAEKSGIERATIYNRLKGRGEWKISEVKSICNVLRLTDAERNKIFFN